MVFFLAGASFSHLFSQLLCPRPSSLKPIHNAKAPGGDTKALATLVPQMRSMTPTRSLLNTNAPKLPQLPTRTVSLGPSRWSPCAQNLAVEILRTRATRGTLSKIGPPTVLRSHGKNAEEFVEYQKCRFFTHTVQPLPLM